jgi:uncharacterized linocin/CFP29 family protein
MRVNRRVEMRYLPREDAPFGDKLWEMIEGTVIGAARSQLAGRRVLDITGPYGLGLRALDEAERATETTATEGESEAAITAAPTIPVPMLQAEFSLPIRDVAAVEEHGTPIRLGAAASAAIACARLEDQLVFDGDDALEISGLLTADGAASVGVGDWTKVGRAVEDLIAAVNALDAAGFPGPYAAAIAPVLYNALYLRYPQGNMTQLDHARQLITAGLVKAPVLESGGVVLASGRQFATIVIGQDMAVGFVGPAGPRYEFVVVESLCPRILVPEAICVLEPGK